jgi:general secretion pathway protein H
MKTPTSIISTARSAQSGFTLIELLAVLAILALAIAAFSLTGRTSLDTAKYRALMVHTLAQIQQARADAMRSMSEKIFYIDVRNRRLSYPGSGEILELPPDLSLTATVAQSEQYKDGSAGIRFYPGGNSTGGVITFGYRGQTYEIRVNWLTGNVALARV